MDLKIEILINQYGQKLKTDAELLEKFESLSPEDKRYFLKGIEYLIIQSKVNGEDIDEAIKNGRLKPTFTPCVILKKGLHLGNYEKVINLPENELNKVFRLFINLFKVGYYRRYLQEQGHPHKWWYWDLSDIKNIEKIIKNWPSPP